MEGFLYPNDAEIQWTLLIVVYPYITGLVAGAFIASALYHVFGIKKLESVSRLSLLTALAFVLAAPLPLLGHLGRPERGFNIFFTPNLRSAMAGFGYIWMFYTLLVLAEIWLVFRRDIVVYANSSKGFKRTLYSVLALGVLETPESALHLDEKLIKILAFVGIPSAVFLHGYVGFIFGAIKANPWWSSPLMPVIFVLSAIVSGIALLTVLYVVSAKIRREPLDHDCVGTLAGWLLGFLAVAVALEALELVGMMYEAEESWEIIRQLLTQRLNISLFVIQVGFGAFLPGVMLAASSSVNLKREVRTLVGFLSSCAILIGVFAMRWNVVIGGQMFSKSFRGLNIYEPSLLGNEGILVAMAFLALPVIIFVVLVNILPPWKSPTGQQDKTVAAGSRSAGRWGGFTNETRV